MSSNLGEVIADLQLANSKCESLISSSSTVGLDCEGVNLGREGELCLIQVVGQDSKVLLFDILTCPEILTGKLKTLLEHPEILKIIHDCRADRSNLKVQFGVDLQPVFDTQIAYKFIYPTHGNLRVGWNKLCQKYHLPQNPLKEKVRNIYQFNQAFWKTRPMTREMLVYASADVIHLRQLQIRLNSQLRERDRQEFQRMCKDAIIPVGNFSRSSLMEFA